MIELAVILGSMVGVLGWLGYAIMKPPPSRVLLRLAETVIVPIAQVQEGQLVRIRGRVNAIEELLRAPLSGRPCVCYEVVVRNQLFKGYPLVREVRGTPFAVHDETGYVIIDSGAANVALEVDRTFRSDLANLPTPALDQFLARHGLSSAGGLTMHALHLGEGIIEPGEIVTIAGHGIREPEPEARARERGYRDELATRLRLTGSPKSPLLVSDRRDVG